MVSSSLHTALVGRVRHDHSLRGNACDLGAADRFDVAGQAVEIGDHAGEHHRVEKVVSAAVGIDRNRRVRAIVVTCTNSESRDTSFVKPTRRLEKSRMSPAAPTSKSVIVSTVLAVAADASAPVLAKVAVAVVAFSRVIANEAPTISSVPWVPGSVSMPKLKESPTANVPGSKLIVRVSDPSTTTKLTSPETRPLPESNTGPNEPPPAESKLCPREG